MIIDKLSVRRLAKEQLKEDATFTTHDAFMREEELLADDNISFDENWTEREIEEN